MLLSNGKDHCIYIKDYKCTIYNERPSICQVYPLSANLDNIVYYDMNCPAISEQGSVLVEEGKIAQSFNHEILDNYQDKYILTHQEFEPFNKKENFKQLFTINNEHFYKYVGSKESEFMKMHGESLKNLDKYGLEY